MRLLHSTVVALVSASLITGCALVQQAVPGTMSDANIISLFNTIDQNEVEGAQLAQQKASSRLVRDYAERIVREHTALQAQRQTLAEQIQVQPETPRLASRLDAANHDMLLALSKTSGLDFDRAYIDNQITMHNETDRMAQESAPFVDDSRLRQQLRESHPDFAAHAAKARSIRQQLAAQH